jgi:hypothetical protein
MSFLSRLLGRHVEPVASLDVSEPVLKHEPKITVLPYMGRHKTDEELAYEAMVAEREGRQAIADADFLRRRQREARREIHWERYYRARQNRDNLALSKTYQLRWFDTIPAEDMAIIRGYDSLDDVIAHWKRSIEGVTVTTLIDGEMVEVESFPDERARVQALERAAEWEAMTWRIVDGTGEVDRFTSFVDANTAIEAMAIDLSSPVIEQNINGHWHHIVNAFYVSCMSGGVWVPLHVARSKQDAETWKSRQHHLPNTTWVINDIPCLASIMDRPVHEHYITTKDNRLTGVELEQQQRYESWLQSGFSQGRTPQYATSVAGMEWVYVFSYPAQIEAAEYHGHAPVVKIGMTLGNPKRRINEQINSGVPEAPVHVMYIRCTDAAKLERDLHKHFTRMDRHHRKGGGNEWFKAHPYEILKYVSDLHPDTQQVA